MGDLIAALGGALLFVGLIFGMVIGVMALTRRTARRQERRDAYAVREGRWETGTITDGDTTKVIVRRVADTRNGPRELERITVALVPALSATWTQDVLNAQAEAEQRVDALRAADRREGSR